MHIDRSKKKAAQRGGNNFCWMRKMSWNIHIWVILERYILYSVLNYSESIDMQTFDVREGRGVRTSAFLLTPWPSLKSLYALHGGNQNAWATFAQPTTPQVYNPMKGKRCGENSHSKMFNQNLLKCKLYAYYIS